VSRAAAGLTGHRHVDLLGRAGFIDLVDPDDAAAFVAACRGLTAGVHAAVDHGVRHADGSTRRVRTTMVGTAGADGRPTVSGVTIPVERTEPV
jgi:PAS domain-containing protein